VRYLVDTHVFLWRMAEPHRLSPAVISLIENTPEEIAFSAVSGWEIAIKSALGKLSGVPLSELASEIEGLGWTELRFELRHAVAVAGLPFHHHDPFDRALIAQAIVEDLTLVTSDPKASHYPVRILW
jgi:PIN domain nuclease of toxin-antitoxin system